MYEFIIEFKKGHTLFLLQYFMCFGASMIQSSNVLIKFYNIYLLSCVEQLLTV